MSFRRDAPIILWTCTVLTGCETTPQTRLIFSSKSLGTVEPDAIRPIIKTQPESNL